MINHDNCIIDKFTAREFINADRLNPFSAGRMIDKIIMILVEDPEDAQEALVNCIVRNERETERRNERSRAIAAQDAIEDAKFA